VILCVYALASRGVKAAEPLQTITVGDITAIARRTPRPPNATDVTLRMYDRTLRDLAGATPAMLPVRFGTCFDDVEELRLVLRARQDTFRRALRAVRGRAQMTLRVALGDRGAGIGDRGSGLRDRGSGMIGASGSGILRPDPRSPIPNPASPGTAYLRGRLEARVRQDSVPGFDPIRTAVRRWVRDERVEKHGRVASVYHLVPRGSVDVYRRGVMRAAEAAGLRVLVSGPFPPYAFSTFF
jgi:gas vesicle protein GvpL/GvpF